MWFLTGGWVVIYRGVAGMREQFWGWFEVWGELGWLLRKLFWFDAGRCVMFGEVRETDRI